MITMLLTAAFVGGASGLLRVWAEARAARRGVDDAPPSDGSEA